MFWYRQFPEDFYAFGIFVAVTYTALWLIGGALLTLHPTSRRLLNQWINSKVFWVPLGIVWAFALIPPALPLFAGLGLWLVWCLAISALLWIGSVLWHAVRTRR